MPNTIHVAVRHEDDSFWATVEEFPGLFATGESLEELGASLDEGIALYAPMREAHVLLEVTAADDLIDASDDLMAVVERHASDLALGPVISLNLATRSIKLRFNVLGTTDAAIHERVAQVADTIERRHPAAVKATPLAVEPLPAFP